METRNTVGGEGWTSEKVGMGVRRIAVEIVAVEDGFKKWADWTTEVENSGEGEAVVDKGRFCSGTVVEVKGDDECC